MDGIPSDFGSEGWGVRIPPGTPAKSRIFALHPSPDASGSEFDSHRARHEIYALDGLDVRRRQLAAARRGSSVAADETVSRAKRKAVWTIPCPPARGQLHPLRNPSDDFSSDVEPPPSCGLNRHSSVHRSPRQSTLRQSLRTPRPPWRMYDGPPCLNLNL